MLPESTHPVLSLIGDAPVPSEPEGASRIMITVLQLCEKCCKVLSNWYIVWPRLSTRHKFHQQIIEQLTWSGKRIPSAFTSSEKRPTQSISTLFDQLNTRSLGWRHKRQLQAFRSRSNYFRSLAMRHPLFTSFNPQPRVSWIWRCLRLAQDPSSGHFTDDVFSSYRPDK